jgi:hypothetical protein
MFQLVIIVVTFGSSFGDNPNDKPATTSVATTTTMGPIFKTREACEAAAAALRGPRRFHALPGYPKYGGGWEVDARAIAL